MTPSQTAIEAAERIHNRYGATTLAGKLAFEPVKQLAQLHREEIAAISIPR